MNERMSSMARCPKIEERLFRVPLLVNVDPVWLNRVWENHENHEITPGAVKLRPANARRV